MSKFRNSKPSSVASSAPSACSITIKQHKPQPPNAANISPPKTSSRSAQAGSKTQSAIESALGVGDRSMVTGLTSNSQLEKPQVGVHVDRFGKQKMIEQVFLQTTVPEPPTEPLPEKKGLEIEIRTVRSNSNICRNFTRRICRKGKYCPRVHIFDPLDETNKMVLRDVFKGHHPQVVDTHGTINQACLLFTKGRCNMGSRCSRIHLIPSNPSIDSESELQAAEKNPMLKPATHNHITKLVSADFGSSIVISSREGDEIEHDAQYWVNPHTDAIKWDCETDISQWLDTATELDKWSAQTDASLWLDSASDSSESSSSSSGSSLNPTDIPVGRPPPRYGETCWRWLKGTCERGYACLYVHGDLHYDKSAETRSPPTYFTATVHDHIRIKLSYGFSVQELTTGFETPWVYVNNIPVAIPNDQISHLLSKHGTIQEIVIDGARSRGFQRARVRFSNDIEARNVNVSLNGTRQWGSIISTQLPVNTAQGRSATLQDNAIRLEWEAPSIVGYAGYPTAERANKAIAIAKAAYSTSYISAHLYSGLPQMAAYTVRFQNLPIQTKKVHMMKYAHPEDVNWDMPNYTSSVDDVATVLRRKLETSGIEIVTFEVLPPPYRDGMVKAWIYFPSPAIAKEARSLLHLRKPVCTGRTRIFAYHMLTLSYSIPAEKYNKISDDLFTFRERLRHEIPGVTLTITNSGASSVMVELSAVDRKDLGHLKAEFEKLRGGEVIHHDGEILWDRFFGLTAGKIYLRQLEIAHPGLSIREDVQRRRITLFGQSKLRQTMKSILIGKVTELAVRERRYLFLGSLLGPFIHYEFSKLSEKLGPDKVYLDDWNRRVVVSGHDYEFRAALQAVHNVQRKYNPRLRRNVASCPVCFAEVDCPVMLSQCKHSYCRSCLIGYLQSAIDGKCFPLTCLGNDDSCSSPIPISVARQVLAPGEFEALVEAAFDAYVHERPKEFYYCPSPDCMQVYRPAPSGNVLQCPSCLLRICPQCHIEQHDDFDCPDRDGGDREFNEWATAHNVKSCPSCKVPIERAEGCNHVTCIRCRTHICWVCMRTFPGGDGIYSHMRQEHGGIGNAFDADGL
ncbi:hypothetical protein D9757_003758 [Collybiopsis confluens]|uniref:RBR-type E3 ubiquitin transferase n=1 Tax=Collybiopsis confluens TaxID=2823264 RepID=A0A8H5MD56_9AGAR|nr:hypothetical protein D9757_003758 [Collybiopsis confluens]